MRSLLSVLVTFLLPLAAVAQPPAKEVIVTNTPLPVQCEAAGTFGLVGFTSTVYTGNLGGVLGSTQKCQLDFPSSRMCTQEEIQNTLDLPDVIAEFAWMEPLSPSCQASLIIDEQEVANLLWSCNDSDVPCRDSSGQDLGRSFESTGSSTVLRLRCSAEQPIACCGLVP